MSPRGLGSVSFLTDHRTVQGHKGFHSPPENLLQAVHNPRPRLILYWKSETPWGRRRSVFKQHFKCHFLFGRQLPNFGGDCFCVVAARSEPEPQSKTTLNKQPAPPLLQKTHQLTMSLLLGCTLFNIHVPEQSKIIAVLMIQLRKVIPAHFTAKNSGAFLYSWPSFIAFIVISSEDYLISPECQQHIDLLLKLNNSLNNALGRHFSQPVIFRQLGEHGASRKRKSTNVFLNRF